MVESEEHTFDINEILDYISYLRSEAQKENEKDYLEPRKFYVDTETLIDYLSVIIGAIRRLTTDLLAMRRFSTMIALKTEAYGEIYYLRAYLLKHVLNAFFEEDKAYFFDNLELRGEGGFELKFKLAKHKFLKEFDIITESLLNYDAYRVLIQTPDIDEDKIYVIWGREDQIRGLSTIRQHDIRLLYVDMPEANILRDYFAVKKLPAIIYPKAGVVLQGMPTISYLVEALKKTEKQDKYIESSQFINAVDALEKYKQELFELFEKAVTTEWWNKEKLIVTYRKMKPLALTIKKILWIEMNGFARANPDLFAPIGALSYMVNDVLQLYIAMEKMYEKNIFTIQRMLQIITCSSMVLGITDFLRKFRPADVQPPYDVIAFVGHKHCPHCIALKEKIMENENLMKLETVKLVPVDAVTNWGDAINYLLYVYLLPNGQIIQTMDTPLAYYGVSVFEVDSAKPLNEIVRSISEDVYEKYKKEIEELEKKRRGEIRGVTPSKVGRPPAITLHPSGSREVWESPRGKLTFEDALVALRMANFTWNEIQFLLKLFFGKSYSEVTLQKIYKKKLEEGSIPNTQVEEETKKRKRGRPKKSESGGA